MTNETNKLRALFLAALMVLSVTVGSIAFAGSAAAANANFDIKVDGDTSDSAYQGQDVNITGLDNSVTYDLRSATGFDDSGEPEGDSFEDEFVPSDSYYVLDTDNLEPGYYYITGDELEDNESNSFELRTMDLDAEFDGDSVEDDEPIDLDIDANRGEYDLNVSADGLDEGDLSNIFNTSEDNNNFADVVEDEEDELVTLEGVTDDTFTANFTDITTGDYTFEFESTDTTASASDDITVSEAGEGELSLEETSVTQQQGDVAVIDVNFEDTEEGMLTIGELDDDGFQANISINSEGDDQVSVAFNTYEAGNDSEFRAWVVGDTDAEVDGYKEAGDDLNTILDTGDYGMSVSTEGDVDDASKTIDESDDVGTLWIEERSTDSLNVWTASTGVAGDFGSVDDVATAVDDGELTETDTIARNDELVLQLGASGLSGMLDMGDLNTEDYEDGVVTEKFTDELGIDANEGFNITLEQLNPGSNQNPNTLNFADLSDIEVFYDEAADEYYIIADTNDGDFADESDDTEIEDGDEFEATFELKDDWLLEYNDEGYDNADDLDEIEDEYETVMSEFTLADRDAEFDTSDYEGDDLVVVEAAEEQEITGTTNIAPGSEVSIRAEGTGDARFVEEKTELVVQEDGTFSGTFDFSEMESGTEFEVTLRGPDAPSDVTADGLIQEAQPEETTTEETTEETTTEETTTETTTEEPADTTTEAPADTTTEAPEETPTETPGFTMGLALVALLGAALLALRRN